MPTLYPFRAKYTSAVHGVVRGSVIVGVQVEGMVFDKIDVGIGL